MVRRSAPGPGRCSGPGPRHPPRGSRNVRMVAGGPGLLRSPSQSLQSLDGGRLRLLLGAQAAHRSRGPSGARAGALVFLPRRLAGPRGSSPAALGRGALQLGPRRPVAGGRGARGRILPSSQAAGCGGEGCAPGRLGLGLGSRARTEPLGASHQAFPGPQLPGAGCAGSPAPAPGPELAASASQPQHRAESWEALPFQLQPENRPARRGGVTSAWGGLLGWGWGE